MYFFSGKHGVEFFEKIIVINEILKHGRVEIGLQDTIGAVHLTERSDVQNFITAACISARAGAFFNEGSLIAGKKQNFFALSHRICRRRNDVIDCSSVRYNFTRQAKPFSDETDLR